MDWAKPTSRRRLQTTAPTERSCLERLAAGFNNTGFHLVTINGTTHKVYCDMDRHGGGWTLLMNNGGGGGFDSTNLLSRFPTQPSLSTYYSIIGVADTMLEVSGSRPWRYMVEVTVDGESSPRLRLRP